MLIEEILEIGREMLKNRLTYQEVEKYSTWTECCEKIHGAPRTTVNKYIYIWRHEKVAYAMGIKGGNVHIIRDAIAWGKKNPGRSYIEYRALLNEQRKIDRKIKKHKEEIKSLGESVAKLRSKRRGIWSRTDILIGDVK